jgi:hypothetical protein
MSHDPNVRVLGQIEDIDGQLLDVGVDYGTVAIYVGGWLSADGVRLDSAQAEEFGRLFIAASWRAGQNAAEQVVREAGTP